MDPRIQPIRKPTAVALDTVQVFRALYVGTSGNVSIETLEGTDVVLPSLAAGVWHPIEGRSVNTASTTASGIFLELT